MCRDLSITYPTVQQLELTPEVTRRVVALTSHVPVAAVKSFLMFPCAV
jgi:hypothetical protein